MKPKEKIKIEPKIINISSRELSSGEITLLEKGLKFAPTPNENRIELKQDLQDFGRKMRLLEHFDGREQQRDTSLVKNKSNYVPPLPTDQYLSVFLESISNLHETENNEHGKKRQTNINSAEEIALKTLKEDSSIIIKQADKGGATVVMDKTYYKNKILQLLEDRETYIELPENEDNQIMKKINKLTKTHKN